MARPRGTPRPTHHASGQAVVRFGKKDYYLGPWGSKEAKANYEQRLKEYRASDTAMEFAEGEKAEYIEEVVGAYWVHCHQYYRKNGAITSEVAAIRAACNFLLELYDEIQPQQFTPRKLKAVRNLMIERGLARGTINDHVHRIRRMFEWAAGEEIIDAGVWHALLCVKGLRRHRGGRETPRRRGVSLEQIEAIEPHVAPQVAAMMRVQWATGMRPGEVVMMTTGAIDRSDPEVWSYDLGGCHKTDGHEGHEERKIQLGRSAQEILRPWLREKDPSAPLFQPREAMKILRRRMIKARKARGGVGNHKKPKRHRRWKLGEHYSTGTYRRAIWRGCDAAAPPPADLAPLEGETEKQWYARLEQEGRLDKLKAWHKAHRWSPHQIRHSFATRVWTKFSLEEARVALGHSSIDVTMHYLDIDNKKAREVALKIG